MPPSSQSPESSANPSPRDPAPAVSRALRVLTLLAESHGTPRTLSEIARELGIAKSSTSNLCAALEEGRMIRRTGDGYALGMRAAELGGAYALQFHQIREFFDVVDAIPALGGELVQIAAHDDLDTLYLARYEGRERRLGSPLGSRLPLVHTATGVAILSALGEAAVEEVLARSTFAPLTDRSSPDADAVRAKVARARELGYALDEGGSTVGVTAIATPLTPWHPADPQLALGVALPGAELDAERREQLVAAVLRAADALTNPLTSAARTHRPTAD